MEGRTFLHLIHRYYPFQGGSENYFRALSERLVADGADVHLFTTDAWDLEYFWDPRAKRVEDPEDVHNGVRIHRTSVRHLPVPTINHRAIRRAMAELARMPIPGRQTILSQLGRFGPWLPDLPAALERSGVGASLIHPANIGLESMIAAAAQFARRHDIPLVITPKLHLGENARSAVRRYYTMPHQVRLLKRADMIMTQTSLEAEFLGTVGISASRLRVVGLGIDLDSVTGGSPERSRGRLGVDGPIVLALGAAAFDKGTLHLIDAVERLNRRKPGTVTLVCAGPMMSEVTRYVEERGLASKPWLRMLGFVDDQTRTDLLAASTVLALPSRTEAFGYVILEAWANGKPVIGARAGGIPAVVRDGVDGLLVGFGDVDGLARAIETTVDDFSAARRMGEAGRQKVVSEDEWYGKVRSVYCEVLGIPSRAGVTIDGTSLVQSKGSAGNPANA